MGDTSVRQAALAAGKYADIATQDLWAEDGSSTLDAIERAGTVEDLLEVGGLPSLSEGLEVLGLGGVALGAQVLGPIFSEVMALKNIGEANLAAEEHNEQRKRVSSFANGLASALDPSYPTARPTERERRASFDKGRQLVADLSPQARQHLEDSLVFAREHATAQPAQHEGKVYREAIMDLWEGTWRP